jgi:hypothetical protein
MTKDEAVAALLTTDEGRQHLAHSLVGPPGPFQYVPSPTGSQERAYAVEEAKKAPERLCPFLIRLAEAWEARALR